MTMNRTLGTRPYIGLASSNVLISNSWLARINPNVERIRFGLKR